MGEDFRLKWNDHHTVFFSTAEQLCHGDHLTDVTLSCGSKEFSAHKLVLSICSTYFNQLFASSNARKRSGVEAIVYLKDVDPWHMELLLNYMYRGEINVEENELMDLLATAKSLQIKGLTEAESDNESSSVVKPSSSSSIKNETAGSSSKRPSSLQKPSNVQNQPPSKRIKEEIPTDIVVADDTIEDLVEDGNEAGDDFNDDPDYVEMGGAYGEAMAYEGDPENPGGIEGAQCHPEGARIQVGKSERGGTKVFHAGYGFVRYSTENKDKILGAKFRCDQSHAGCNVKIMVDLVSEQIMTPCKGPQMHNHPPKAKRI